MNSQQDGPLAQSGKARRQSLVGPACAILVNSRWAEPRAGPGLVSYLVPTDGRLCSAWSQTARNGSEVSSTALLCLIDNLRWRSEPVEMGSDPRRLPTSRDFRGRHELRSSTARAHGKARNLFNGSAADAALAVKHLRTNASTSKVYLSTRASRAPFPCGYQALNAD